MLLLCFSLGYFFQFEQENKKLYEELNALSDEVKNIEGRVIEISQLQKVFTEKVLEQDEEVERIAHTLGGATENVKDGNEQLRQVKICESRMLHSISTTFFSSFRP